MRISEACSRANALVLAANRRRDTRRSLLGFTCAVVAGTELLVAHIPPGQLVVRQGHTLFAFPEIREWGLPALGQVREVSLSRTFAAPIRPCSRGSALGR